MSLTNKVSNHIPHHLSFNILSKLPVKSLKRFTCVCKFWANLFQKPQFMRVYRNYLFLSSDEDRHNSRLLLKMTPEAGYDDDNTIFLLSGDTFENRVKLDWPPPFEMDCTCIFVAGSVVNGIVCLYQGHGSGDTTRIAQKLVLWNPSTEEFKVIPSASFEPTILKAFPPGSVFEDLPLMRTIVNIHGFGYDPITDDYKLIQHFCFFDDFNKCDPNNETVWQIYSLKSNCWRDLQIEMPNHSLYKMRDGIGVAVYFNGICHWWAFEDSLENDEVLVSFNLSEEVFIKTPFNHNYDPSYKHLVVLKESIAMIECVEDFYLSISILGEFGVAESWTKLFSIGPLVPDVLEPIGVGKHGDIFYLNRNEEVARINVNTEVTEEIGFKGRFLGCQMVIYNESLLPIGGIHN